MSAPSRGPSKKKKKRKGQKSRSESEPASDWETLLREERHTPLVIGFTVDNKPTIPLPHPEPITAEVGDFSTPKDIVNFISESPCDKELRNLGFKIKEHIDIIGITVKDNDEESHRTTFDVATEADTNIWQKVSENGQRVMSLPWTYVSVRVVLDHRYMKGGSKSSGTYNFYH